MPQTIEVSPVRSREEPLTWVREEVVRDMGRHSLGRRSEGRSGGVEVRCAWRRAGGEMSGIAEGGMVVVVSGEEVIVWFEEVDSGGE
jgi:hypothetical protein